MVSFAQVAIMLFTAASVVSGRSMDFGNSQAATHLPNCPGNLTGTVLMPTMMLPVSHRRANRTFGPINSIGVYTPNDFATVFNFQIPAEAANKTCYLYFSFPNYAQLGYKPEYSFRGNGNFAFTILSNTASRNASYASLPPPTNIVINKVVQPGSLAFLGSMPCPTGIVSGIQTTNDTTLIYYQQNKHRCPLGHFVSYA